MALYGSCKRLAYSFSPCSAAVYPSPPLLFQPLPLPPASTSCLAVPRCQCCASWLCALCAPLLRCTRVQF